ncbi:CehA/McbA family metallohydrolase [Chitinimonas viridis]|uniref:CehA/McbA family metallohydrolase n=1 Tax=Chitinimonas viridis TaxID=664880 RepID=A0ABT8B494_9NEIS|nr:CehA/McbA family metallohydrolase [Chitinimonas viridis]MDN3576481.1 CehA/McbA family metallohydrolase [Chitinimonas viridis]
MREKQTTYCVALALSLAVSSALAAPGSRNPDHFEFDATLSAPYAGRDINGARTFALQFDYPGAHYLQTVAWRLELLDPKGKLVERWDGESSYLGRPLTVEVPWAGRSGKHAGLPDGTYSVQLHATVADPVLARSIAGNTSARVSRLLQTADDHDRKLQRWDIRVGNPAKPAMPRFAGLPTVQRKGGMRIQAAPATGSLPYTVYYGNLHSQTNDSDGGGAIGSCTSSQPAQTGQYGPADAFSYARNAGLDFLMTSEHNHYFDGSSSTNSAANPTTARNRYQAGLAAASNHNTANPDFLALYGMEWGVINNGGHLNILNAHELLAWEYNSSNQLIGDRFVAKNDYANLYATMKQQGWIGQFNHPERSGQFLINGTALGYDANGDEVMVATEIMNTSAFSSNTTETETGRSNYESAYNMLLERGYHVAPTTNQDNHCANWGTSYTNRTGVLIPQGAALNLASFVEAMRARRVFASMDKQSQLIFTANGHIMGARFSNSGPLTLTANFANSAGRSVTQVQIFEGVPRRNGTVTLLSTDAVTTVTPAVGEHFYYAKLTQDDGKVLWSAPVWVNQTSGGGGTDTTPPTVTATVTGSSGNISLAANASDNVGVSNVEFLVDGSSKGSDNSTPYSLVLDSTTLANGSHTLVARAHDAAGNSASSNPVSFNVSNSTGGGSLAETESNGSLSSANVAARTVSSINGTMGTVSDKDYYKLTLNPGETLRVNMSGPTDKDYDLYLVNGSDSTLKSSLGNTCTESLSYTNGNASQTVYLKVISYKGSSSSQRYTLTLSYTGGTASIKR